jgi:hypothetical protein
VRVIVAGAGVTVALAIVRDLFEGDAMKQRPATVNSRRPKPPFK